MSKYYGYKHKSTLFNDWISFRCKPASEGLLVTDLDFVFFDYKKRECMLIETKTYNAKIKDWQLSIYKAIDKALRSTDNGFKYNGFYIVTLDTDSPETATLITINDKTVTSDKLVQFLDFELHYDNL